MTDVFKPRLFLGWVAVSPRTRYLPAISRVRSSGAELELVCVANAKASQLEGLSFPAVGTGSLQRNQENKPEVTAGVAFQVPRTGVTELVPSATKVPVIDGATVLVGSFVTAVVNKAFFLVGVVRLTELAKTEMNLPT